MTNVQSKDGTAIAFDRMGDGPPIILVVGAFNDRSTGAPLAAVLERHFTVFNYDRRGRGGSGDTAPYAVDREIEDLEALIVEAGGSACVFGYSSGAVLVLKAAARGLGITKLALYEAPLMLDTSTPGVSGAAGLLTRSMPGISEPPRLPADFATQLADLVAAGRRGDTVELFQTRAVGIPVEVVAQLRQAPFWPALEAIAHTLVYEATILGDMSVSAELLASISAPTLLMAGGDSPEWMRLAAQSIARTLPSGQYRCLDGQTHDIVAEVVAPVMHEFFEGSDYVVRGRLAPKTVTNI